MEPKIAWWLDPEGEPEEHTDREERRIAEDYYE